MFILDKIIIIKNLENKYNIIIYFNKNYFNKIKKNYFIKKI